ncbi:MAG: DUF1996 domain-containing protein [Actinobacteria bacterium]|nr:DUF1996 domain-containing protein [Actinomycetota bacterium]
MFHHRPPVARSCPTAFFLAVMMLGLTAVGVARAPSAQALEPDAGWKSQCKHSQSKQVDPIVSPGVPSAHLHEFFGTRPDENSNYDDLRNGGTICPLQEDTAGYWIPSLYTPNTQGEPTWRKPVDVSVYYQGAWPDASGIQPFPPNLKVVAGVANAPPESQPLDKVWFDCGPGEGDYSPRATKPYLCVSGDVVRAHVRFPSCWDGVPPVDIGNDSSHMAYPIHDSCPTGYIPVPEIHLAVSFAIQDGRNATLASGGGKDDPNSIYTLHADYFHAWEQAQFSAMVDECMNEADGDIDCGIPRTPVITRLDPPTGQAGDRILVGGNQYVGVTSVKFGGMPAAFSVDSKRFITAIVPPGATTGFVTVTSDAGTDVDLRFTGTSAAVFTVT